MSPAVVSLLVKKFEKEHFSKLKQNTYHKYVLDTYKYCGEIISINFKEKAEST